MLSALNTEEASVDFTFPDPSQVASPVPRSDAAAAAAQVASNALVSAAASAAAGRGGGGGNGAAARSAARPVRTRKKKREKGSTMTCSSCLLPKGSAGAWLAIPIGDPVLTTVEQIIRQ